MEPDRAEGSHVPNRFGDAHTAGILGAIAAGYTGQFKRIWIAACFACLSQFGPAEAQDTAAPTELLYQFNRPTTPGDPFSLRFPIPAGYESAIVICDQPGSIDENGLPVPEDGSQDLVNSIDWARALFLLLPNSDTGMAGLNGTLPEGVSLLELSQSIVQVRIFLANRTTGHSMLSDPIPLGAALTTPDEENTEAQYDVAADSILSVADLATETDSETADSGTSGDGSSGAEANSDFLFDTNTLSSQQFQPLPLTSLAGGAITWFSIHDQPIPVQGSGH